MRSLCCVNLQLADENGVVHLRQDRSSASTNLPRQNIFRASAEMTKIKASECLQALERPSQGR